MSKLTSRSLSWGSSEQSKIIFSAHRVENKMTTEMDIYQDMVDDPATLTSQLFSMPCNFINHFDFKIKTTIALNNWLALHTNSYSG